MAVTQADIDALNVAIATGVRQATIGGQTITYNTIDSLIKARNDLRDELARQEAQTTPRTRPKQTYIVYSGRDY